MKKQETKGRNLRITLPEFLVEHIQSAADAGFRDFHSQILMILTQHAEGKCESGKLFIHHGSASIFGHPLRGGDVLRSEDVGIDDLRIRRSDHTPAAPPGIMEPPKADAEAGSESLGFTVDGSGKAEFRPAKIKKQSPEHDNIVPV